MKTLLTLILSTFLFSLTVNATICTSLSDGAWENPTTWSCGVVPSAGDTIIIAIGQYRKSFFKYRHDWAGNDNYN